MILSSLALAALLQDQQVAVLRSGTRVAVSDGAIAVGARSLPTPAGTFDALLDPVVEIVDGSGDLHTLEPLKLLDYGAWLQRVSERGFLDALLAEKPEDEHHRALLYRELESWGRRIDPLSKELPREERVDALWTRVTKSEGTLRALLCGRLQIEIGEASGNVERRIGIVALRRALRGKDAGMRWAAARVAAHQREYGMQRVILTGSLEDEDGVSRAAAASALMDLDDQDALGYWAITLFRAKPSAERARAAEHLGEHGAAEPDVVKALVMALGAEGYRAPGSYIFIGRQISIVQDFDVEVALAAAIADPRVGVVTEGVSLEVRVISTMVANSIRSSLQKLTGENPGRSAAAWRAWYEAR